MVVLGIDPGLALTGWGVVKTDESMDNGLKCVDFGVIETEKTLSRYDRLAKISEGIKQIVKKFSPDAASVEQLFWTNNQKTAMAVGEARGVTVLALHEAKLLIKEFTPLQVKDAVCGYGKADKKQVQTMVQSLLELDGIPKPDDAADGLAVAIACVTVMSGEETLKNSE